QRARAAAVRGLMVGRTQSHGWSDEFSAPRSYPMPNRIRSECSPSLRPSSTPPPRSSALLPAARADHRAHPEFWAAKLDVLLVDDDADTRESIEYLLTDAGHHVTAVGDGGAAMRLIAERVFDAAICDIQLPRVDGLTLLRQIRHASPSTAVILVTGYAAVD